MPDNLQPTIRRHLFLLLRSFVVDALLRGTIYTVVVGGMLFLAAQFLKWPQAAPGDDVGQLTLTILFALVGGILGFIAGITAAAQAAMQSAARAVPGWLAEFQEATGNQERLSINVEQLRSGYDGTIEQIYESMVDRIPLPHFLFRICEKRIRLVLQEGLLADCHLQNSSTIGLCEVMELVFVGMFRVVSGRLKLVTTAIAALVIFIASTVVIIELLRDHALL